MATATTTIAPTSDLPTAYTRSKTWTPNKTNFRAMATPSKSRSSSSSSMTIRPPSRSSTSTPTVYSKGWYNADEENMTLEKIAERLNTYAGRFERFMGLCATNIVMALFRPTPLVIFLFHPLLLIAWAVIGFWWFSGWMTARAG